MTIVTTIRTGHKIKTADDTFEVVGNMKFRSGYKYVCRNSRGQRITLDRDDVIAAQRDGDATVTA